MISGNYTLEEVIGTGSFGTVYKAYDKSGKIYAIKMIQISNSSLESHIEQEISVMRSLMHKNIIQFINSYKHGNKYNIVLEYCEGGDLENYLQSSETLPLSIIKKWAKSIITACAYLQDKNIMHRDIKLANLYLTDKNPAKADIKIGDFGFSRFLNNNLAYSKIGTPLYMAPEIFESADYTFKADVWSLGCVLYEMITKVPLFPCYSLQDLFNKHRENLNFPDDFDEDARALIFDMVKYDFQERPNFADLLEYDFLKMEGLFDANEYEVNESMRTRVFRKKKTEHHKSALEIDQRNADIERLINIVLVKNADHTELLPFFVIYIRHMIKEAKAKLDYLTKFDKKNPVIMIKYKKFEELSKLIDDLSIGIEINTFNADNIPKDMMISSINRLIQLLYEYGEEEFYLLLGMANYFDHCNSLVVEVLNSKVNTTIC
ncbi:hypothetical protein SteCoe_31606 [Stentor coeruleus]|uniref:Protein kinase domain-containing protein n=1 Tax=Stentor coeruleus TaxID=5963 RepID=A0A1R2B0W2_9CILI|nr:hypothetical protein SteCoe_31606 [Stentor coeruleus]